MYHKLNLEFYHKILLNKMMDMHHFLKNIQFYNPCTLLMKSKKYIHLDNLHTLDQGLSYKIQLDILLDMLIQKLDNNFLSHKFSIRIKFYQYMFHMLKNSLRIYLYSLLYINQPGNMLNIFLCRQLLVDLNNILVNN